MVLFPRGVQGFKSLAKTVRSGKFDVHFDTTFEQVITAWRHHAAKTAAPGSSDMQRAYTALHKKGIAHCAESWRDGQLVGGLYGVALGRVFFGESMFTRGPTPRRSPL